MAAISANSRRIISVPVTKTNGAIRSISMVKTAARCGNFSSPMPIYWIREFHLDGLRFDATQQIFDASPRTHPRGHRRAARVKPRRGAASILSLNTKLRTSGWCKPAAEGGYGLDSLWNDDFHHSAIVALTGRVEAYYSDYRGAPQEFISMVKYGYLYQGQRYLWQKNRRGTPSLKLPPDHFVSFLENHDQVANSLDGRRLHEQTSPGMFRAMTALLLLGPNTPMLFQGQEFACLGSLPLFCGSSPGACGASGGGPAEVSRAVSEHRGRRGSANANALQEPGDEATFHKCKLDHSERFAHASSLPSARRPPRVAAHGSRLQAAPPARRRWRSPRAKRLRPALLWRKR